MKSIIILGSSILSIILSSSAFAGFPVSPGNVPVAECDLPSRFDDIRSVGTLQPPPGLSPVKTVITPGKDLAIGDAVFYVKLQNSRTYYSISKSAQIIDKSPFTPDTQAEAGKKYQVWSYYTYGKTGQKFVLLNIPSWGIPIITQDGKLCSAEVLSDNNGMKLAGMSQAYQAPDAVFEKSEEPVGDDNSVSIAITLKDADAVSVTFEVAYLRNGRVENRKTVGFDRMSGEGKIGTLNILFGDGAGKTIRVKSVEQPDNWSAWLKEVFSQVF